MAKIPVKAVGDLSPMKAAEILRKQREIQAEQARLRRARSK